MIMQGFDGIELRRLARRIEAKEDAYCHRHRKKRSALSCRR